MFCQKCGKQIPENATFCPYCGTKQESVAEQPTENITPSIQREPIQENLQETPVRESEKNNLPASSPKSAGFKSFLIVLGVVSIIAIIFIPGWISNSNNGCSSSKGYYSSTTKNSSYYNANKDSSSSKPKLFSRSATNADVLIDEEYDSLISIKIKIRPYCDIKGLELTINHYSKNGTLLETQKKTIGNVIEGNEYTTSISLLDFSFSDIFDISKSTVGVTGGTVSYFQ